MGFSNLLNRLWRPIQHLYVVVVIIASWVLFRSETLTQAMDYFNAMTNISNWDTTSFQYAQVIPNEFIFIFITGLIFSLPIYTWLKYQLANSSEKSALIIAFPVFFSRLFFLSALLSLSVLKIASSTYNPFIYFRF
jgi:alginate O-acetyltransferase complex protein AlgI